MKQTGNIVIALILILCCRPAAAQTVGQSADERAGVCMNSSDWFGLKDVYRNDSAALSPFMKLMSKALVAYYFNRPQEMYDATDQLIKEHQAELGLGNVSSMIQMQATALNCMDRNREAAVLIEKFCSQIAGKVDSTTYKSVSALGKKFRALSAYKVNQWKGPKKDVTLKMADDTAKARLGIYLQGAVNGTKMPLFFDTGAGTNVVSPEVAEKTGMTMLDCPVVAEGINTKDAKMAIAREIQIGGISIRNVLFFVLDMTTGNEKANGYLKNFDVIMGRPIMNLLGEMTLDFENRTMTISAHRHAMPKDAAEINTDMKMRVWYDGTPMTAMFDTGCSDTHFNYPFFEHNKTLIQEEGKKDTIHWAGYGGIVKTNIYRMPIMRIKAGRQNVVLTQKAVATDYAGGAMFTDDATFGIDFARMFRTITINMKDMYLDFGALRKQ
jgi:predicted aspartyl protease